VDYEAVPRDVEYKDMMTTLMEREAVPQPMPQSDVSLRLRPTRGFTRRSDAGLMFLRRDASRLFGAFRSPTK
jgi:hypothetical protein